MVEGHIVNGAIQFASETDFREAITTGFFKIRAPARINLQAGRLFPKTFTSNPYYTAIGEINVAEGFLKSKENQTVRFTLEQKHWPQYYPPEIQELGRQLNGIGMMVLRCCFEKIEIPQADYRKSLFRKYR